MTTILVHKKLFQEWGKEEIKENGGGGKFKYDIFDIL
jgi:hypothetical protein